MNRYDGKVVLITGATRGLGSAAAIRLAEEGASVVLTGRNCEGGAGVEQQIRDSGFEATYVYMDSAVEEDVIAAVDATVAKYGKLDVLVNNSAPVDKMVEGTDRSITEMTTEEFDYIIKVGLYGQVWATKFALREILKVGRGSVLNISSMASVTSAGGPAYTCTKGALNSLTRQVAATYGKQGVTCNAILVGTIPEGNTVYDIIGPRLLKNHTPSPRLGLQKDFAALVAFLCSDEAEWINGACVPLDGGNMIKAQLPDKNDILADMASARVGVDTGAPA